MYNHLLFQVVIIFDYIVQISFCIVIFIVYDTFQGLQACGTFLPVSNSSLLKCLFYYTICKHGIIKTSVLALQL